MEHLGNIEQTNDVAIFITYRLHRRLGELASRQIQLNSLTKCRNPLLTINCKASVAEVVSRVTIGFLVMI